MKIGTLEYWRIHTGSCNYEEMPKRAKKEIHSIHSYKGHTWGRPVNLKEIFIHSHNTVSLLGCLAPGY